MATIKYLLQSKSSTAPVYTRLSLSKNISYKRKTGFVIDFKNWSTKTGYPKTNDASSKQLKNKLKELDIYIIKRYNDDYTKGLLINGNWLASVVDEFHGRTKPNKTEYLTEYGKEYLEKLPHRITKKGTRTSKDTVTKYTTIVKKLIGFEEFSKRTYLLKEVDLQFKDEFFRYLTEEDNIGDNTAGRYLSFVKTILLDARKNGITLSPQIDDFKGFTVKPPIVTLNFEEIELLIKAKFETKIYGTTRDWLIIGCYIGQRVSDLLRLTDKYLIENEGYKFIEVTQKKTKKTVYIPLHKEVKKIMDKRKGQFPPIFSKKEGSNSTIFNRHLKEVCRLAGIDTPTKGNLNNPKTNRYETAIYPKWMLVSSHICRRSFATNFYGLKQYPTPMLRAITGHSSEAMFLGYIGKEANDFALQLAKVWDNETEVNHSNNKAVKLTVIKNASNQ